MFWVGPIADRRDQALAGLRSGTNQPGEDTPVGPQRTPPGVHEGTKRTKLSIVTTRRPGVGSGG